MTSPTAQWRLRMSVSAILHTGFADATGLAWLRRAPIVFFSA
ncbi:MAG: hypothetical protein V4550_19005 [Gemmatimonadota bacterium]